MLCNKTKCARFTVKRIVIEIFNYYDRKNVLDFNKIEFIFKMILINVYILYIKSTYLFLFNIFYQYIHKSRTMVVRKLVSQTINALKSPILIYKLLL